MSNKRQRLSYYLSALCFSFVVGVSSAQPLSSVLASATHLEQQGATDKAVALLRDWRTKNAHIPPSVDFQLLYARLLLREDQGVEALGVLRTLQNQHLNTTQQELYTQLQLDYALYKAGQLRSQGDMYGAAQAINPVLGHRADDPRVQQVNADIQYGLGNNAAAYQQYKQAAVQTSADASLYLGLARTAASQHKTAEADAALQQVLLMEPENIRYLSAVKEEYAKLGRIDQVGALTQRISMLKAAQLPALDTPFSTTLPDRRAASTRGSGSLLPPSALQNEYDAIMGDRSATITVGAHTVQRDGDAGTSRLSRFDEPVEIKFPVGNNHVKLQVTPVQLHAGSLRNSPYAINSFGGGPVSAEAQTLGAVGPVGRQQQNGVGGALVYTSENVEVDLGVTPVGFEYKTFTGGIKLMGNLDDANTLSYKLNLSRRPITESLLSFAGTKDPRTGQRWGGVTATGVRADLTKEVDDVGVYGALAWHHIQGHNVLNNRRTEANLGFYTHVFNDLDELLTVGANLNATMFANNQRYFTYGHGGYFSPQHSFGLAFPVTWAARTDKATYLLGGSVGVTRFKEDGVAMYPTNGQLQDAAMQALAANPSTVGIEDFITGYYPGQRKTTFTYGLRGAVEYRLTPQVLIGTNVAIDNANDYKQLSGGFFFRYYFYPQTKQLDLPVRHNSTPYDQSRTFGAQ